ncbi:1-deoxy-D-xylulose-5-phosphate synthase [Botrimarina colliarenosi]|uniref:1-deoxy-D-xylulose-5-phosphate synthase n=1 Tax=Botrimarina colliarenosi TaxID=2528001 RepID=A0A5C6AF52_9BACT|nr:transketolase C-terminal domain-containing protein [Botrimarina colliarenosi]TWT97691.1 1-deoxy-D-xylulose-5-phosphate synthase [Botrimarina colliarenosi]
MSAPAPSLYSEEAVARAKRLGLRLGRANLEVFADTLLEIATPDHNVLAVTSDSRGSGKLKPFGDALPRQIVEVGIAEQNLIGVSAGLASAGKTVFAVSPACFLATRSLEQIKNDVCYSDMPVTLVGISAGVSYGALGSTHHSLHDFAALRAIHNVTVVAPADNREAQTAVRWAAHHDRPVYLRFGKAPLYDLASAPAPNDPRDASLLRQGDDVAFIATGETVIHCLLAADRLAEQGVETTVLSVPCVKPLDETAILAACRGCRAVVTAEEHSVHGGLGDAVAALLLGSGVTPVFRATAIPDEDTYTGSQADIFRRYGLSMEGLADRASRALDAAGVAL